MPGAIPPRSCSRARTTQGQAEGAGRRVQRRPRGLRRGARRARQRRGRLPADHDHAPTCTCRARRSRRWRPASSSRSRSSTGPTPTSSAPRPSTPSRTPDAWNPYAALPEMRLFTYQMPDELIADREPGRVRRVRPQRVLRGHRHRQGRPSSRTRTTCRSGSTSSAALTCPPRSTTCKMGTRAAVPVLRRPAAAVPAALVLVPAQRRACHAMANLLAEKQNVFWHDYKVLDRRRARRRHRAGRAPAGARGDRRRPRHQDDHPVVRQAHHGRHRPAVVLDPDAAQPQLARDLLPGRVPRAVTVVDQEPRRRRPERRGDPQAGVLRVRLRAHPRAAPDRRLRRRSLPGDAEPRAGRRGAREVPAGAGLRRLEHDPGRRRRHPRHRHVRHLRDPAGPQVGVRDPRQRRQRHPAQDHEQPRRPRTPS